MNKLQKPADKADHKTKDEYRHNKTDDLHQSLEIAAATLVFHLFTLSLSLEPALNLTTLAALIFMGAPVLGLRP